MNTDISMGITTLASYDYRSTVLAFSLLILFSYSSQAQSADTDWEVQIDKNGIKIFSRWHESQGEEADKVREIKANFKVSADRKKLISVLQDTDQATSWMVGAKSFSLLASNGPKSWYTHTEFNLPWPFQNQDLIALYKVEQSDLKTTKVKVVAHPKYRPELPNIERLQHFEACWTFRELGDGNTEVIYWAFTYRKPSAPRWVVSPIIQNTLWKTMSGFRELAEE